MVLFKLFLKLSYQCKLLRLIPSIQVARFFGELYIYGRPRKFEILNELIQKDSEKYW